MHLRAATTRERLSLGSATLLQSRLVEEISSFAALSLRFPDVRLARRFDDGQPQISIGIDAVPVADGERDRQQYEPIEGYTNGIATRQDILPGWEAAALYAFFMLAYFWPVPTVVFGLIGALAGFGSLAVKPRPRTV